MSRRPPVPPALTLAALLTTAACTGLAGQDGSSADPSADSATKTSPSPTARPALTQAQARAALVTDADLGAPWTPTQGVATWRDGLLKAKASAGAPDCQSLLDALYADELLGEPTSPGAAVALDDDGDQAQLRYQVGARRPADVDRALAWLGTLPQKCGQFTATTTRAGVLDVRVDEVPLPRLGDARQGLRITLTGQSGEDGGDGGEGGDGEAGAVPVLTLDVVAVRVGEDAISVTNGGLGAVPTDATLQAAELGTQRLTDVQRQQQA